MTEGRSALIVGAAPAENGAGHYHMLVEAADVLIAADGGLLICLEAGRVPDYCVGDFDSTPADALASAAGLGAQVRRFPADKDVSDLDLAVSVARELGCTQVTFTAAFAGRLDHTLAALGPVVSAADLGGACDEPGWWGIPVCSPIEAAHEFREPVGTTLSVIAMGADATVNATGLAYPMSGTVLSAFSSRGLSNVVSEHEQRIEVVSGSVLVIVNRGRWVPTLQSRLASTDTL